MNDTLDWQRIRHLLKIGILAALMVLTADMLLGWGVNDPSVTELPAVFTRYLSVPDGRIIASDGMPSSVYDGYEDIQNRTLYVEYVSKIISGEFDIDKFDEFVDRWYKNAGTEVTERVREWYAGKQ